MPYIYLFIANAVKRKRLTSIMFDTIHNDSTVLVLLHEQTLWFFNCISIITNCT